MCNETTEIVKAETVSVLRAKSPADLVAQGRQIANILADVIEQQQLYVNVGGDRRHVTVEGWTTLLAMLGVRALVISNEENADGDFIAWAELRDRDGNIVGRDSNMCGHDEPLWKDKPKYARRSMAATRAIGKAARGNFSWIITMSGFQPTPAEEMDSVQHSQKKPAPKPARDGETGSTLTIIRDVQHKEGETNGRKWIRWGVRSDQGEWFSTFDEHLAEHASSFIDSPTPVRLHWVQDGKWKTLTKVEA